MGEDDVADLILMNYKAQICGRKYGPDSTSSASHSARWTVSWLRMLTALEAKVGNHLLAVTSTRHAVGTAVAGPPSLCAIDQICCTRICPTAKKLITASMGERPDLRDEGRLSDLGLTL